MISHLSHVMTLANGVIGVSVLAMPFCFKQCGVILGMLLLLLSSILSRIACHFLVKSAVMSRRRNFEFLAFHAFGRMGKFFAELFIIGFLLGTCIAFFVVVGDLGPVIVGKMMDKNPEDIRTSLLIITGVFVVLPLGLLRNIDSLSSISTATIVFYICLVLKVMGESTQHIFAGDWYDHIIFWRPAGILQCLPIFSMALFCQTQLFEIYESVPNVSLEKMNEIVRGALNICTGVYVSVGLFGYIACCTQPFTGNILMSFEPSPSSEIIKLLFVISVAFSFPLVIFPCRASLNSLLFRRAYLHEATSSYMPETRFRFLTFLIVSISLIMGIMIPNIEFVLGIVGATIGVMICLIFPAAFFISISSKNTNERLLAQAIVFVGFSIMILGTYVSLNADNEYNNSRAVITTDKSLNQINNIPLSLIKDNEPVIPEISKNSDFSKSNKDTAEVPGFIIPDKTGDKWNLPKELPVPVLPVAVTQKYVKIAPKSENIVGNASPKNSEIVEKINNVNGDSIKENKNEYKINDDLKESNLVIPKIEDNLDLIPKKDKIVDSQKSENLINSDAIKKEESELAAEGELAQLDVAQRHEELKRTLEKHKMEQLEMMQEQKEILKDIKEQQLEFQKERLAKEVEAEKKSDQIEEKKEIKVVNIQSDDKENLIANKIDSVDHNVEEKKKSGEIKKNIEILNSKINKLSDEKTDNEPKKLGLETKIDKESLKSEDKTLMSKSESKTELEDNPTLVIEKKTSDHILNALTNNKKILENEMEGEGQKKEINVQNVSVVKDVILNEEKETNRLQEYSLPIALKMNNQTKSYNDSGKLITENKKEYSVARRDILENHDREKREIEDQAKINKQEVKEQTRGPIENRESCMKNIKEISIEHAEKEISKVEDKIDSIIKTNVYLSQQGFTEKISIDTNLGVSGDMVQLKKRDLKALKSEEDRGLKR